MSNDINAGLPALLREVKSAGYRLSNLFHRADGMCQANLRHATTPLIFAWAYGPSFTDALQAALDKARGGKVAPMAVVGDDARDARQIGGTKEVTKPIHPGELEGADVPVEDDDLLLGGAPAAADDDDDLIG